MIVNWSRHCRLRVMERIASYNIYYGDMESEIIKQVIKIKQDSNLIKTIFKVDDIYLTAIKKENKTFLKVITIWESTQEEAEIWKKKQYA
ncbi:MAG: hypothetical protein V1824_01245 [archaeon]